MTGVEQLTERDQRPGDVFVGDRAQDRDPPRERGAAEERVHLLDVDASVRDRLVEQRQRVAHRAGTGTRDDRQRLGVGVDPFLRAHVGEMTDELVDGVERELVVLRARADRRRDLQRIGRGQHEHHVLGRLLERLEQRGLGAGAQHVHLVEDVDLLGRRRR